MYTNPMGKKLKWLAVIVAIAVIAGAGYILFINTRDKSPQTQQQAINEALEYRRENKDEVCAQVVTPAVHTKTGAKYSFGTGCLPPGWEEERLDN